MLVTAATNAEEAYTLLNEIVGIGDFTSADLTDFSKPDLQQVGKKERSIGKPDQRFKIWRLRRGGSAGNDGIVVPRTDHS